MDTKQKYEQRVRALAEKMARKTFTRKAAGGPPHFDKIRDDIKESWINEYMISARIAVAEMAEAVIKALEHDYGPHIAERGYLIYDWLIQQGLLPDNAQEGGQS